MTREVLAQEWRQRLDDFQDSQMTVQEWCDFNHVSIHQYYYWRRRLSTAKPEPPENPRFLALNVVDTPALPTAASELTLRIAGAEIAVTPGFDPGLLRAVVSALSTQRC